MVPTLAALMKPTLPHLVCSPVDFGKFRRKFQHRRGGRGDPPTSSSFIFSANVLPLLLLQLLRRS